MPIPARILRSSALTIGLLLSIVGLAQAQDKPRPAATPDTTATQPSMPALPPSVDKRLLNMCPVCGKTRSECFNIYEKSKKDPSLADKVCDIWKPDFATGKTRPWNCPICGWKVRMPLESIKWRDVDTDLCPYPMGKIRFTSEITICPRSGFAAFQEDFRQPQSQVIKDWVAATLTPIMEKALRARLGTQAKATTEQLYHLFDDQENIPDTLRCGNAYQYYAKRMQMRDEKVKASGLARVAWMAAWAERREVGTPLQSGPLMDSVRKISEIIQKSKPDTGDLEGTIRLLTELYNDRERFDIVERQILRVFQAGYYNRLGLNYWAMMVLQQAQAEAQKKYPDAATDPWMQCRGARTTPDAERLGYVNFLRVSIIDDTRTRLNCLTLEGNYLANATDLMITALKNNEYPEGDILTFVYMAGEFMRRQEQHSRALLWLDATRQMLSDTGAPGVQNLAPAQVDLLKRYVNDRRIVPDPSPLAKADWALLQQLAGKVAHAQQMAKSAAGASKPDAPGSGTPGEAGAK